MPDRQLCRLMQNALIREGYTTVPTECHRFEEALKNDNEIALAIIDCMEPETVREVARRVPTLSLQPADGDILTLEKPFTFDDLNTAIDAVNVRADSTVILEN